MPGMGLGFCCCCLLACLFVLKERDRSSSFFVATHRKYCQKHNNFPYDYFSYFSQNIFPRLTFVRFSHEEGAGQHSKRRIHSVHPCSPGNDWFCNSPRFLVFGFQAVINITSHRPLKILLKVTWLQQISRKLSFEHVRKTLLSHYILKCTLTGSAFTLLQICFVNCVFRTLILLTPNAK